MARLSATQLRSIVARDLPGYQLVARAKSSGAVDRRTAAEDVAPELKVHDKAGKKRRNSKRRTGGTPAVEGLAPDAREAKVEDELVTVERKDAADPFDHSSRRKAVVISGEDGRVIGSQG